MKLEVVNVVVPEGLNIIVGMSHFIKTVEDLYECLVTSVPNIRFGLAFCEASGSCLVRYDGNDDLLKNIAIEQALKIGAGHCFVLYLKNVFPINVLNSIKNVPEICSVFCATANPVQIIVAETEQGRGILGVIDGQKIKDVEKDEDVIKRKKFLRDLGYKL